MVEEKGKKLSPLICQIVSGHVAICQVSQWHGNLQKCRNSILGDINVAKDQQILCQQSPNYLKGHRKNS